MFDSLLIANRGEIACRIARTARELGVRVIAVYSDADRLAPHVRLADEAVRLGPAPALESYLNTDALLEAIELTGAQAVHPGYGFFSENADFADAVAAAGAVFVGPPAAAIRAMGSKIEAKRLVAAAGAPVVPGYNGDDQGDAVLSAEAERIGYPLLIKASAGGGGKGMRLVDRADQFLPALSAARREAAAAFADDRVLLERYLTAPKHIEVQVMFDSHGHGVHLFERDCSVQRRHQKVIEEAPAPGLSAETRAALGEAALTAAQAIDYVGAGTVEFIAEGDDFFFMEMNTRLQVEHPVTEAITGVDLVEAQLRVASGEPLAFGQDDLAIHGHAVEARVYAENPAKRFLPSTGELRLVSFPADVRVDSGVETGGAVTMHYDPMIAKVIAHAQTRQAALHKLDRALAASAVVGVSQNIGFLRRVLTASAFVRGGYTTHLIEDEGDALAVPVDPQTETAALLSEFAAAQGASPVDPWARPDGFAPNLPSRPFTAALAGPGGGVEATLSVDRSGSLTLVRDDITSEVSGLVAEGICLHAIIDGQALRAVVLRDARGLDVVIDGVSARFDRVDPLAAAASLSPGAGAGRVRAPMPGQVISVEVAVGDSVVAGQVIAVVEAMKMEHPVVAPRAGRIKALNCAVGARVDDGFEMAVLAD